MSRRVHTRSREETAQLQHEAEHTSPSQRHSVFVYLAVLVLVAFFLLLLAYLQQQRNNKAAIDSLQQSHSAVESLENLIEERDQLKDQLSQLEDKLAQAEKERDQAQADGQSISKTAENYKSQRDALQILNQIRYLYNHNRYQEARGLIAAQPDLEDQLSAFSAALSDEAREVYDPLDSYQKLKSWLRVE